MPQVKHFPLPDVGEGLTEAEILGWHVQPGDTVTVNQIIVEIETAKAAVELPCPYAGVVTEVLAQVGETVNVGSPIIAIDVDPSGAAPAGQSASGAAGAVPTEQAAAARAQATNGTPSTVGARVPTLVGYGPRAEGVKRRPRKDSTAGTGSGGAVGHAVAQATSATAGVPVTQAAPVAPAPPAAPTVPEAQGGYVPLAKPPVRKLAKELGIDLRALAGSQQHGVITREDVEQAARGAVGPASAVAESRYTAQAGSRERRVPIRGVRKATAQAVSDSAFTAPHVTEFLQVDVTPMMEFRARLKDTPAFRGVKLTPLAFAAKAVCLAVRRTPDVNATWDEAAGEIVYKDYVHLGIAAATPRGLVVPKIHDADQMSLRELAEALAQLTEVARAGKTTPAEMLNGTFTITNVGVFGVDTGTPILNPGESAILAFGAIRDMPWVVNGEIVPRKICQLALSFDHRVVDGQQGSTFLADLGALLADPGMAITY